MNYQVKELPALLDWWALKSKLGWPFGRTHTERLERRDVDPFPKRLRLCGGRRARIVWNTAEVLAWLDRQGVSIKVPPTSP